MKNKKVGGRPKKTKKAFLIIKLKLLVDKDDRPIHTNNELAQMFNTTPSNISHIFTRFIDEYNYEKNKVK